MHIKEKKSEKATCFQPDGFLEKEKLCKVTNSCWKFERKVAEISRR